MEADVSDEHPGTPGTEDPPTGAQPRSDNPQRRDPPRHTSGDRHAGDGRAGDGASPPGAGVTRWHIEGDGEGEHEHAGAPFTQQLGRIVLVCLAVLFGIFAVYNSQHVDFSWVFGETTVLTNTAGERVSGGVRLILLLLSSLVIGVTIGLLAAWQSARARRRAAHRHDPEEPKRH